MAHPAPLSRDAIIFIPGLGTEHVDQAIDGIARRIQKALDANAATAEATFRVEISEEEYGSKSKTRLCTIYRKDDSEESPVLDLYEFSYLGRLTEKEEVRPLLLKALSVIVTVFSQIPALFRLLSFWNKAKSKKERFQIGVALLTLVLLLAYLGLLGHAIWEMVRQAISASTAVSTVAPSGSANAWFDAVVKSQVVVVFVALIATVLPAKFDLRKFINRSAVEFLCTIRYLAGGERSSALIGQLEALIEHISEKSAKAKYRAIHVISYSLGSILALDTLYPATNPPAERLKRIDTLVTIGCPFDFIRAFWPHYFTDRRAVEGAPRRWFNVYDPCDVFGSNFRDDEENGEPEIALSLGTAAPAIPPPLMPRNVRYASGPHSERRGVGDTLLLMGLRSHSLYWETPEEQEKSAFSTLMPMLYEGDGLLK